MPQEAISQAGKAPAAIPQRLGGLGSTEIDITEKEDKQHVSSSLCSRRGK